MLRTGADFVPILGPSITFAEGLDEGNGWKIAEGAVFLTADVLTLGGASVVKGSVKAGFVWIGYLVRKGKVTKSSANLLRAAGASSKGGLTAVGRALQKHGSRSGSLFPKVTGNAASINAQGQSVLKGILNNPNVTSVTRHHARFGNVLEYRIPGGQGARFSADGKTFFGFIE